MDAGGGERAAPGMSGAARRARRWWPHLGLVALVLLHHDVLLWDERRLVLGLPAHLLYHVVYCLVVAGWMAAVVRHAWPAELDDEDAPGGA